MPQNGKSGSKAAPNAASASPGGTPNCPEMVQLLRDLHADFIEQKYFELYKRRRTKGEYAILPK
jgi:hypothetical protein